MRNRSAARLRSAAWIAFLAISLAALHRLGDTMPLVPPASASGDPWPAPADPAAWLVAIGRLAALAVGWYLLVASVLVIGVRLLGWWRAAAVIESVVPTIVRRAVHGAIGLSLVATPSPALASPDVPAALVRVEEAPGASDGDVDAITMRRLPNDPPAPEDPPAPVSTSIARTWTITPGDHLWSIAERVLQDHLGRPPTDGEIDPYWRSLVEVNRPRLAQPDVPDLVYPGQVLEVPSPSGAGA